MALPLRYDPGRFTKNDSQAMHPSHRADPIPPLPRKPASEPPRVVTSDALLMGAREIRIAHAGETYRLAVTRQGKLILTK